MVIQKAALLDRQAGSDTMSALLTLENVGMHFGVRAYHTGGIHTVFEGINLELHEGERLGVVGRNGAGKSTLLKIMAKIYVPASGRVLWAPGVSVSLLSLGLGFSDELTGRDNAYLAGLLQGFSKSDARANLEDIQEFCEIGDFFDEPVRTYSAGMRARLGFATALLNSAGILLIDEILSVGDHEFRRRARAALENKLSDGRAAVLVSHAEMAIKNICTRAILLEGEGILTAGTPAEVLAAYAEASAAG